MRRVIRFACGLALSLAGCSRDGGGSSEAPRGPAALEVEGLDRAGARLCVGSSAPPASFRLRNVGRTTFVYAVKAPVPVLGGASGRLTPGSTSAPLTLGGAYDLPSSVSPHPPVVITADSYQAEFPVVTGLDPQELRVAPQTTDLPGVAGLVITNPTSVPFVGTLTPPPGFTVEPAVAVQARGRVVVKLALDAAASAKPAEVTGTVSVSNAACPGREARATVTAHGSGRAAGVAAGDAHSCLVDTDGAVWCWGDGRSGQLGVATAGSSRPVKIPELVSAVTAVRAGAAHTCALRSGKVLCWGAGDRGQLGTGVIASRATPAEVPGVDGVVALAAGGNSTCAVRGDGHMSCWGADVRMSEAAGSGIVTPTEIFPITNVSAVSLGRRHACLLRTDGTVGCWGISGAWLGDGTANGADLPVTVPGLASVTSIAVGETHTCAGSATSIACWGDSRDLGLLDGTTTGVVASPRTRVDTKLLCAGPSVTCVLNGSSETPTCWGGALTSARFASTTAACGPRHACFVRSGAGTPSVGCGGDDDRGQAPESVEGF